MILLFSAPAWTVYYSINTACWWLKERRDICVSATWLNDIDNWIDLLYVVRLRVTKKVRSHEDVWLPRHCSVLRGGRVSFKSRIHVISRTFVTDWRTSNASFDAVRNWTGTGTRRDDVTSTQPFCIHYRNSCTILLGFAFVRRLWKWNGSRDKSKLQWQLVGDFLRFASRNWTANSIWFHS